MRCPFCSHEETQVVETRESDEGDVVRRRRRCQGCDKRFTTYERTEIAIALRQSLQVTLSVGGAFAPQWVRSSGKLWMERADQQLYRAKQEGRNRACLEMPPVSVVSAEEKGLLFGTPMNLDTE